MFRENRLSRYLIASLVLHIIVALAMSAIYAEQSQLRRPLEIKSAVRIEYKDPEPPPKPKVVTKVQPKKVAPKKPKPEPKKEPEVEPIKEEPPKVTRRRRRMSASAPSLGVGPASRTTRAAPGSTSRSSAAGSVPPFASPARPPGARPG